MSILSDHPSEGLHTLDWNRVYQLGIGGILNLSSQQSNDLEKLYMCWLLVIQAYSERKLTKGSDKLAALAGIASEFQRAMGDNYHAGLWDKHLWRELLWHVSSPGTPCLNRRQPKKAREGKPMEDFKGKYFILVFDKLEYI